MLEVKAITKKYHVIPVLNSIQFTVRPSEVLGYLGPNGAGKTTTINILAGLLEPTEGEIYFQGSDIKNNLFEYKKRIGYVPENSEIYPHMSAYEYLLMVGRLRHIPDKALRKKIEQFMEFFQLSADMHSSISSYSRGMVQKVLLSSALLHNPDILLLDEPLSGLDVTTSLIMKGLVQKLAKEGKIIIYSSHILEIVEKLCSRVIIIHKGSIVADDSVDNLRKLMKLPSLEEIFSELIIKENSEEIANALINAMKYNS